MGTLAALLTVAAAGANVVWFARHGVGPLALLVAAGPLWLGVAAFIGAVTGGGWLLGRLAGGHRRREAQPDPAHPRQNESQ
ncbi:hypothetical protein U7230_10045 [Carboxydochorda subterranea]|uniref:Lipopolysaccharide assembly protein A domain-containing protein n=1 Tax=Carboxydichorda subterranea TaxID=3109565 RepID=A0ABZ1BUF7_9FIRM|nr:hypothetical protein [Limnochorda sp. L945t]WRP16437.1 hypothetical protein U7230_10045 [Limnochorda sp. L945t]